jgi:hypothetical protein
VSWIAAHTRDGLEWRSRSGQVMAAGLLLTATVVFAQMASQWIDFRLFNLRLRVLDSDHHASVFGAMSIVAQAVAAAAIGLRAVSTRRPAFLPVAALVGVLTVPRALMRYEPVFERYDVPILVAPFTVVFVVLCALALRDARRVRFMVWGSLVLLAASFALHAVGPQADSGGGRSYPATHAWAYQVTGMFKHGAELAGWMLLTTGIAAGGLASQGGRHAHRHLYRVAAQTQPTDGSQLDLIRNSGLDPLSGLPGYADRALGRAGGERERWIARPDNSGGNGAGRVS